MSELVAPVDWMKNPSYPARIHLGERPALEQTLRSWEARIAAATATLAGGADPVQTRLYGQLLGARDQLAEAVRRIPQEVGELYHEDHHRLEQAVAALERVFARIAPKGKPVA